MKRYLKWCTVLIAVLLCLSLAACGGGTGEDEGQSTNGQNQPEESSTAASDELTAGELFADITKIEGMSYDIVIKSGDETVNGKFYMQGNNFKFEQTAGADKAITIVNGDTAYSYIPEQNMAVKVSLDQVQQPDTPVEYTKGVDESNLKILETTEYDGVKCKVVSVTGPDGNEEAKMWVREDYGIPIRVETTENDGSQTVMEYKNLEIGKLPADTFEIPSGVQIMDMGDMMEQMPEMPQMPE